MSPETRIARQAQVPQVHSDSTLPKTCSPCILLLKKRQRAVVQEGSRDGAGTEPRIPSAKLLLLFNVKALGVPRARKGRERAAGAFLSDAGFS